MSIDLQLAHSCPHLVIEEPVAIGVDRRSLVTLAPVASTTVLRVIANNTYYVPSSGLYSQAVLKGDRSGPFRIEGCATPAAGTLADANVITITSSTETRTFRLPLGTRVTTDSLVRLFREGFTDIVAQNSGGFLEFADVANIGPLSFLRITGRGAEALGFKKQWAIKGQEVFPPWGLNSREDSLPWVNRQGNFNTTGRYVQFSRPVRSNPTFKVTYASPGDRCPRCRATFVENDWRFDVPGNLVEITDENLLYQAALKMLLTRKGTNPYHPTYGATLMDRIGAKAVGATAMLIQEDVRAALSRMQTIQTQQAKFQQVSLKERLYAVLAVEVLQHKNDPTTFLVDVVVTNGTGVPVSLSIVFAVPGAVALAGTNNLTLGLETTGLNAEQARLFGL